MGRPQQKYSRNMLKIGLARMMFLALAFDLTSRALAQTNAPVRLAVIPESGEVSAECDLLTAKLSGDERLQLLERAEIERVYREQGMSEANRDDLKLGRILGADGLLLLNVVRTPQATNLMARLIAVKPGVILTDGSFPWPLKDMSQWSGSLTASLDLLLPKLTVPAKDAIPVSVVNLRSAIQSVDEEKIEQQLKLLTIERLSQEKSLFVLERQKMQLLGEEKQLKSDESAFWDGSYLLDGVVDQDGFSPDTVTISVRLIPPRGGNPMLFEANGSRTNLAQVINRLAEKVTELLKVKSSVPEWSAADEADRFYKEAKWALSWGLYSEAEAAADSAWALGKRDLDCAVIRVNSYLLELSAKVGRLEESESGFGPPYDANGMPLGPPASEADVQSDIKEMQAQHPFGLAYRETQSKYEKMVDYVYANTPPDPKNIDRARHALELYYNFSRNSSKDLVIAASSSSGWKNSEWYDLGINDLVAASKVLQNFNLDPGAQKPVADKLSELRALARSVANWISKTPSVQNSYYVGNRKVACDELRDTMEVSPNIFDCEVKWGCLWQEEPADGIALYRQLMSSPVFCYVHEDLWFRPLERPRLIAWDDPDRRRISDVWMDFLREMDASTNVFMRMEGRAMELSDAKDETNIAIAITNFFETFLENRCAFVTNKVDVLYENWGVDDLVETIGGHRDEGSGAVERTMTPEIEALQKLCSEYLARLGAKDAGCKKRLAGQQNLLVFEKQKKYLKENTPFDFQKFADLFDFSFSDYSQSQASELQPLIVAYKSNLVARSQNASGVQKAQLIGAIAQIGFLEQDVNHILHPLVSHPRSQPVVQTRRAAVLPKAVETAPTSTNASEIATNVMTDDRFFPIPLDGLSGDKISDVKITAHQWFGEKLLLDFEYSAFIYSFDKNGNWQSTRGATFPAIAIFDPVAGEWNVAGCPEADIMSRNNFYHRSVFLKGNLFNCDGGQIRKYDFINRRWNVLKASDGNNYELFAVNGRLYAANANIIFEITDGGNGTRILASTRRRPPVSVLDTQGLGTPVLFAGPNDSLRVATASKIYTWTGSDWREDSATPPASFQPEPGPDGVLFRYTGFKWPDRFSTLSYLPKETNASELCLQQTYRADNGRYFLVDDPRVTLWKMPSNLSFVNLPAAACQSGLYLLMNNSQLQEIGNNQHELVQEKVVAKNGYNAELLCFSRGLPQPQKLFLNFDAPDGCPPAAGIDPNPRSWASPPAWMLATTNILFLGLETPVNSTIAFNQADRIGVGYKAGIWLLPIALIKSAIAAQRQAQLDQQARKAAAREQRQKELSKKYDKNGDGVVDSRERENVLDDLVFIDFELTEIDTNRNGVLDLEELAWFDANGNKTLDENERQGIEIAQDLLATNLLKKYDTDGDGLLNNSEFSELWQPAFSANSQVGEMQPFPDVNGDGRLDVAELKIFLKQEMRRQLRKKVMTFRRGRPMAVPSSNLSALVDLYWQESK